MSPGRNFGTASHTRGTENAPWQARLGWVRGRQSQNQPDTGGGQPPVKPWPKSDGQHTQKKSLSIL